MASNLRSLYDRTKTFVTSSLPGTPRECPTPKKPTKDTLFPVVDPAVDGEDCLHDCAACPIEYPRSFTKIGIDEDDELWGRVQEYGVHAIVATGKTDWVRDVADEKGSVMQALDKHASGGGSKKLMISASNMPPPPEYYTAEEQKKPMPTTVLILPSFTIVEQVTPVDAPELLQRFIYTGPTTRTPLNASNPSATEIQVPQEGRKEPTSTPATAATTDAPPPSQSPKTGEITYEEPPASAPPKPSTENPDVKDQGAALTEAVTSLTLSQPAPPTNTTPNIPPQIPPQNTLSSHPCPHDYIVLLCSHKRRDARCGISAPLLAREFERQLHPLGLYRDLNDTRPGGVGLYFINHVGGHKYSANVLVYRKSDGMGVWLARVAPKHVEGIVKYTILQGKIVHPEMIRGGFYRKTGSVSW